MLSLALMGCGTAPGEDAGVDAGLPDAGFDAGFDAAIFDAGPPLPEVPVDGWANAVEASNVAPSITHMGAVYDNVAADPAVIIGAPDGLVGSVALGDTGHFVIVDLGAGEEAFDGPGSDLVVRELDFASGGAPEEYTVSVANDPAGTFTVLGTVTGSANFDIEGLGLPFVRYVRVESTLTAEQIVGGLGSPMYPGAEIDAVGAYYPGSAPAP